MCPSDDANELSIINGTSRVIGSQLHRTLAPLFFETQNHRTYFLGKSIPYRAFMGGVSIDPEETS